MAAHYVNPSGPPPERRGPPIEGEADAIAIVPFVPVRCKSCGSGKPRTYGQRGRIRYHECGECGLRFRSFEMPPSEIGDIELPG